MREARERFLVQGRLYWLTWAEAEDLPVRVKTSLALTRARARRAMDIELLKQRDPDAYALGYLYVP